LTWRDDTGGNVIPFIQERADERSVPGPLRLSERVIAHDWARTPLGPMETWQDGRRALVDHILSSPMPMVGLWGKELVQLFNGAAEALPGLSGQLCLGRSARDVWPREWPCADALERARAGEGLTFDTVPNLAFLTYAPVRTRVDPLDVVFVQAVPLGARGPHRHPEVEQRTRNTLALLRSIVARSAPLGEDVEDYANHLLGRIEAIARVQLAVAVAGDGIDIAAIVAEELQSVGAHEGDAVVIEGPPFRLAFRPAEKIGLAIHELATNAVKFGALACDTGHLRVAWRIEEGRDGGALVIEWIERGVPGRVTRERNGFGGELVERALPYELSATTVLVFEPGGVRCTLRLPVAKVGMAR